MILKGWVQIPINLRMTMNITISFIFKLICIDISIGLVGIASSDKSISVVLMSIELL